MRSFLITLSLLIIAGLAQATVFDMVVDGSGSGDFSTLQEALNAVPDNSNERTLIFVKAGIYTEKIVVPAAKNRVSVIGEHRDKVIISWNDRAGVDGMSSADTYTLMVEGSEFYMENVTVENTAGNVGQALAIRTVGDKGVYKNCRFTGFQDTYYAHKNRQYNYDCTIEGATDFIYGDATAVFDHCTVNCVKGGQYITAPSDTKLVTTFSSGNKFYHGLMIINSDITASNDVPDRSYYLGRPWQPDASSVYIYCRLGSHIRHEGWSTWNNDNHLSGFYGEYKNTDFDGNPVDISQRASWSEQITDARIQNFYKYDFFYKKNGEEWNPESLARALAAPENISYNNGLLTWDAVEAAIGYVIFHDGNFFSISEQNQLEATNIDPDKVVLRSVRDHGGLSNDTNEHLLTGNVTMKNVPELVIRNNNISTTKPVSLIVYDAAGRKVADFKHALHHSLQELSPSFYLLKAEDENGNTTIRKFYKH
ncbi:pectinesterase family protein [Roseimarinus sediminis]|uniref:pectinesterase family protein n=1 Tax=Roseimarinus sediminis TaxID=1610899 RepID=UPI003D23092F